MNRYDETKKIRRVKNGKRYYTTTIHKKIPEKNFQKQPRRFPH